MRDPAALAVAEISAPHGVRGQVRVRLYDPDSRALRPGLRVELRPPAGSSGHVTSDMSFEILAVEPIPGRPAARASRLDRRKRPP